MRTVRIPDPAANTNQVSDKQSIVENTCIDVYIWGKYVHSRISHEPTDI